jgi:tRNA (guanine37-N1)-methyltransferase
MKISILTVFPELYDSFFKTSLIGRAQQKGILTSDVVSFFDFAEPKERIDSPSFGPGAGMLIKPEILEQGIEAQEQKNGKAFKIFFSPQGKKLNQKLLKSIYERIKNEEHLLLVASRYEGMDSRVEQYYADELISVGDFVLMGGDLPAMCFIEAFLRLIPGIVGKQESVEQESFNGPFVDYPEYTSPVEWKNMKVPEIIRSGNHALINQWRQEHAAQNTIKNHFTWLSSFQLNKEQIDISLKFIPNHYAVLMHGDVLLKDGQVGTTSVTSLDIHDIARSCATYGLKNYFILTPLEDQKKIVTTLIDFWKTGFGAEYNFHRTIAVKRVILVSKLNEVIEEIEKKEGKKPILIATSAKQDSKYQDKYITYYDQSKVWQKDRPVLIIFGTGHGLSANVMDSCDYILDPVYGFSDFNHLSVRSAAAIILDRWLGIKAKKD